MNAEILAISLALIIFTAVLFLLRSYQLPEKYAVIWLCASGFTLLLALFPGAISWIAGLLGIADPLNLLYVTSLFFILLLLMQLSLEQAKTKHELRRALQKISVQLEQKGNSKD
jgi:hypothetical protein